MSLKGFIHLEELIHESKEDQFINLKELIPESKNSDSEPEINLSRD